MFKVIGAIGKEIIWGIGDGVKRAFTKNPVGKIIDLVDEHGRMSWPYVVALCVRIATAAAALWLADKLGVPVEKLVDIAQSLVA